MPSLDVVVSFAWVGLVWFLQPWLLHWALDHNRRLWVATVVFVGASSAAAWHLHGHTKELNLIPLVYLLLAYPQAMQFLRYLHALAVGPRVFSRHFGLDEDSLARSKIFMWCPPTVLFRSNENDKAHTDTAIAVLSVSSSWKEDLKIALLDIIIFLAICVTGVVFELHLWLPDFMQLWLRIYIMAYSTSLLKVLLECPCTYLLRHHAQVIRIIPLYHRPYLTSSPRDLWNTRWSVAAGYHLRCAFYNPCHEWIKAAQHKYGFVVPSWLAVLVAAVAPFLVNCILHITWWSLLVKGTMDTAYWNLLLAYPLVSLAVQDAMGMLFFASRRATTRLHKIMNLWLLWAGFWWVAGPMSVAQGLHTSLRAVCRANLGLRVGVE